jgi:drug/metabolite transporter (DMT)-like permease
VSASSKPAANIAYLSVIAIWATTPLAITWSNDSLSPYAAVCSRMLLAFLCGLLLTTLITRKTPLQIKHWRLYFVASLGLFPNMPLVYWAVQYIPSGLVSVIFAISPFLVGLSSMLVLKENPFNIRRIAALLAAIAGLCLIFLEQLELGENALKGICAILLSALVFSLSSVWLKRLSSEVKAIEQTLGALAFSLPGLLLCWYVLDGNLPHHISLKSAASITYLAVFGSLIGFLAYFYILQKLPVAAVSVIPLLPPVFALMLGKLLNNEPLSQSTVVGTALIISALAIYEGRLLALLRSARFRYPPS